MNYNKWNEICFLLSDNIQTDISENDFEQNIIQALRVLDWKEYMGDIQVRPSLPVGASNRLTPDFIINSTEKKNLFVIEIKQPSIPLNSRFQQQLFSYMRQLKLEYGILIGQAIQIFYDGDLAKQDDPILLETIKFTKDNSKGDKFVELFSKESHSGELLKTFTLNSLKKINRREEHKLLTKEILSENYGGKIVELIKQDFLSDYDGELIDAVLSELKIEVKEKNIISNQIQLPKSQYRKPSDLPNRNGKLHIELIPKSEEEFKRRLLLTKTAYITTFYENGRTEQKTWNAHSFSENSGVLGNIRSRPQFRKGKWQELGIEKIVVSIDK